MATVNEDKLKKIIVEGDTQVLVDFADKLGNDLSQVLTTSQIRSIFGTVRRIEMDWTSPDIPATDEAKKRSEQARREFALLQPRIAYQAKRERGRGVQILADELIPAIRLVLEKDQEEEKTYQRFRHFVDFFEAILAYHRAYGGRNN